LTNQIIIDKIEIGFTVNYLELNRKTWSDKKEMDGDNRSLRHNSSGNDSGVIGKQIHQNPLNLF
jgi:hypothetical protein